MKMPDSIKKQLEVIKDTVDNGAEKTMGEELKDLAPSGFECLRAVVASIPYVGGGLDHLLFDKYAEIQRKNMQQAIDAMKDKMASMEEEKVSKVWFESEEALEMFRNLLQRVIYEENSRKIRTLSNVYCQFGTLEHKNDPNKFAVLETISKLTNNQMVIFKAINEVKSEVKTVSLSDDLAYTANAKWQTTLLEYCNNNLSIKSQLIGHVNLNTELDIITSFNLIVNQGIGSIKVAAYRVSALGELAYSYLKDAL